MHNFKLCYNILLLKNRIVKNDKYYQFPSKKKLKDENYKHLVDRKNYFKEIISRFKKENENSTDSLFSGMSNMLHSKHPKEVKNCFLSFYNSPSAKTWSLIRDKLIDYNTTSWQVWTAYDNNAPRSLRHKEDNEKYPNPEDFIVYYKQYKKDRIEDYGNRLMEIQEKLKEYQ